MAHIDYPAAWKMARFFVRQESRSIRFAAQLVPARSSEAPRGAAVKDCPQVTGKRRPPRSVLDGDGHGV